MSGQSTPMPEPLSDKRQLIDFIAAGCKPPQEWRIGTEHEKFVFRAADCRPLPYDGGRQSIRAVLQEMQRFGWAPVYEGENLVALSRGAAAITLEPGGQLELSGAPMQNLHQTCDEVDEHLRQVKIVAGELDVHLIGVGYQPQWRREDIPWMPRERYAIMRGYLPRRGHHALDMMLQSTSVQVNLDYASEEDMIKKYRVALALQPLATALFAYSPFLVGKPSGYLSYRAYAWTDTDPDRCGMLPFVFEPGMSFERYVDYALDVPMYFVYRDGRYINVAGQSFRDFMARRLPGLPGEQPTLGDWSDHLTTLYPEVRMKRFLEMRGADGGPWQRLCALPAFWVGLLYDADVLDAAWRLVRDWNAEEREYLHQTVPRLALKTPFRGDTLRQLALQVLALSSEGLRRRACVSVDGNDETYFLNELWRIADANRTPAEELLEAYETRWNRQVAPIFEEFAY